MKILNTELLNKVDKNDNGMQPIAIPTQQHMVPSIFQTLYTGYICITNKI